MKGYSEEDLTIHRVRKLFLFNDYYSMITIATPTS